MIADLVNKGAHTVLLQQYFARADRATGRSWSIAPVSDSTTFEGLTHFGVMDVLADLQTAEAKRDAGKTVVPCRRVR